MEAIREDSHDPGRDDDVDDDERVIGQYRRDVVLTGKSMVTHSNIFVKLKLAGRSGRVVSAFGCDVREPGLNHTADDCVYRDSRCDIQPWARAAHLYCNA